ncbi:Mitochondrial pyruvate carrier 2 [Lignoscripta atroalba]|nr:Mitochondrial pyruvate carrier 2 [Lignoscripta atroalba]
MSSRAGLRLLQVSRATRTPFKRSIGRRYQSTNTLPAPPTQNLAQRLWNSPVGVKTVHFWAPVMKWALVLAGVSDFWRPAEKLSLTQNLALTATGAIWTRWCFIIKPKNILLAAVNFFLGCVGVTQVTRILLYQQSVKNGTLSEVAERDAKDVTDTAKGIAKDAPGAVKNAADT